MQKSKRLARGAIVLAVALVATACGGDGGGDGGGGEAAACTWSIGTMGALSGDFASIGQPINDGIKYAVDQVNKQGDVACELQLVSEDSQGDPEQAPQLAQSLVQEAELVAVVGPYFSGETLATGDIFNDAGVAFVTPSATDQTIDDQGWDTFFRAVGDDAIQGAQAANYIENGLNASSVAVVHDNQEYSKGLADTVAQEMGNAASGPFIINPEETDYSSTVTQIQNVNPDVVYYGGYAPQAGPLARQLQEAGVEAQFLSDDGTKDDSFGELAGPAAKGAQVTCPCADPAEVPGGQEFIDGMQQANGEPPGTFAAEGFDAVNVLAEGLKDFTADDSVEDVRAGLIEYLDGVEGYKGIIKDYTFDDKGQVEVGPEGIYVYEWSDAEGDFAILGSVDELVKQ
jgi:branched-chain amino acid transport system substrate-binding protein